MVENKDKKYNSDRQWKLVNFCEFDKYATKSYCAIHNVVESKNLGDITKVDETDLDDFNMMTWGFPCTDISVAGKQKGFIDEDGEKTRSGMYYEGIRILRKKKPALSIIENVKNLTGKRFKNEFEMVLSDLDNAGYNSYYKVLNAKNYGIPQNRERVFIISIRKDLDNGKFKFPEPFDNGLRLKDLLEDEVDEKFYISDEKVEKFVTNLKNKNYLLYNSCQIKREGKSREYSDYAPTLTSRDYKGFGNQEMNCVIENNVKEIGYIKKSEDGKKHQSNTVYDSDYIGRSLCACDYKSPMMVNIKQATKQGYIECEVGGVADLSYPDSKTRRGRVQDNGNVSPTITATKTGICKIESPIRIRKLTPRETFRLMGFSDEKL